MRLTKTDHEAQELLQELDGLLGRQPSGQQADLSSRLRTHAFDTDSEPPAMIDQAVLNLARRELRQSSAPLAGKLRWIAGLSTASVALIALGISLVPSPQTPILIDAPIQSKGIELESRREESPAMADSLELMQSDEPPADSAKPTSAEAWLDLVRQLQDQGLLAEARAQLQALVLTYPDFPLPAWALALQQEP